MVGERDDLSPDLLRSPPPSLPLLSPAARSGAGRIPKDTAADASNHSDGGNGHGDGKIAKVGVSPAGRVVLGRLRAHGGFSAINGTSARIST